MATPSRGNVQGVSVVGGISVQGDFTYGSVASVTQPGFKEVNLKCGKGFPLIQLPRIQWTKPPRENAIFPSLDDLIKDIQNAFSTVQTDIGKAVDTAKANITASWKKYTDASIGKMQIGWDILFKDEIQVVFQRYKLIGGKEFISSYTGNGAIPFRLGAYNSARNTMVSLSNQEWWKGLFGIYTIDLGQLGKYTVIIPGGQFVNIYELYVSLNEWKHDIDEKFNSAFSSGMTYFKDGLSALITQLPNTLLDIAQQIGTVVKAVITSITNALYTVAQKLSDYAKKVVQASIGMVKNAVNDILDKTVTTLNDMLVKIETGYNTIIQKFNTAVVEPIQCKVKEIEDKLKQIDWVFGIKFPSFPRLPGLGGGGGAYSLPQWFSALSTTLVQIDNKISNLSTRVAILENKVSVMK